MEPSEWLGSGDRCSIRHFRPQRAAQVLPERPGASRSAGVFTSYLGGHFGGFSAIKVCFDCHTSPCKNQHPIYTTGFANSSTKDVHSH